MTGKVRKSESEWQEQLTPEQYQVCRLKGTEPAFSGRYWDCKEDGVFCCAACGAELFDAERKFDSGTGWPSFREAIDAGRVASTEDRSHGMLRTEVTCAACDSHLGHVFSDGPPPSGLRYCINSAALEFVPRVARR